MSYQKFFIMMLKNKESIRISKMKNFLGIVVDKMKNRTVISVIAVIIILFLARSIYSDHNLKKIIGACILAQTQTSSIEEAKQICVDKFK